MNTVKIELGGAEGLIMLALSHHLNNPDLNHLTYSLALSSWKALYPDRDEMCRVIQDTVDKIGLQDARIEFSKEDGDD